MNHSYVQTFRNSPLVLSVLAGIVLLILDQTSKWLADQNGFDTTINRGISFGIGTALPEIFTLFLVMAVTIGILVYFRDVWQKNLIISGIFWGAVASNILDRIIFGGVRDWLPMPLVGVRNNLADIVIVTTLAIIVFRER